MGQHHEKRRRVGGAVVSTEWNLSQRRHLSAAHFVEDLAGLCVLRVVSRSRLRPGEKREYAARDLRGYPEEFDRSDKAVTTERSTEPRDAGVRVRSVGSVCDHHPQVRCGTLNPSVERLVRTQYHARALFLPSHLLSELSH